MTTSVVIRTRNEAPRLCLTLASLERQAGLDEIIVVNDGSSDATSEILAEAEQSLPLRCVHHRSAAGRSAAANAGAEAATGTLLIFLDGDTLAAPSLVQRHRDAHREETGLIGRGETWHLRCTRFLSDPEVGTFWPHEQTRASRLEEAQRVAMRVTLRQVRDHFATIEARGAPGIYPGTDPRRLYDAEMAALLQHNTSGRLWAAASGSNLSLPRALFRAAGGFHPDIDINEHRELAYRLYGLGARLIPVEGARSYHLTHRAGWRDPLRDNSWEQIFRAAHTEAPLAELKAYWSGLSKSTPSPDFFAP